MPGVNLIDFPTQLAEALGISVFAGEMLASCIVIGLFIFPTIFLNKKFGYSPIGTIVMSLMSIGLCIAIGWLDIFFMLAIGLLIALMFSGSMRSWISG